MDGKKNIKDIILRTMHKSNGIVFEITDINPNMIYIVISKKTRYICFKAFGAMAEKIKTNYKIKDRIKIRFYATSKKYKDRWYTDLVVYEVFEWKKHEKKLAMEQSQIKFDEEVAYLRPTKFDWSKELDKFNKATDNQ